VFSHSRRSQGREIKGWVNSSGYRQVRCYLEDGSTYDPLVHRLVATLYVDNPDNLPLVNHKDGDKLNNSADNLEWCDHSGNLRHAYRTGLTSKAGVLHPSNKLVDEDIHDIRERRRLGETYRSIANAYGMCTTTISKICNRKLWKHL